MAVSTSSGSSRSYSPSNWGAVNPSRGQAVKNYYAANPWGGKSNAVAASGAASKVMSNRQTDTGAAARAARSPYARQQLNAQLQRQLDAKSQGQDQGGLLDMLMAMAGGGGGGGYGGPSRAQIKAQGEASRARIESLYKQYADMIAGRSADIQSNYANAANMLGNIYGGAAQNVNNAYDAARLAQTAQLKALGLTEMAPPTNTQQQAYSTSMLDRLKASGLSENEANRIAALNNNLALRNAASAEGARTLSSFDAALASALASAGSGGGGGGGGMSLRPSDIISAAKYDYRAQKDAYDRAHPAAVQDNVAKYNALINQGIDPKIALSLANG